MKAEISERGNLRIIAENETEAWALKCWFTAHNDQQLIERPVLSWLAASSPPGDGDKA